MTVSIEEFAKQGLHYPEDFATGVESAFTTHAQVYGTHRDADLLDQSNWQVYLKELEPGEPGVGDVYILPCSHWAVGWYDHLMVRVYNQFNSEYTPQFLKAYDLYVARQNYPVLDEEDYCQREHDDLCSTLVQSYDVPEDRVSDLLESLEDVSRSDDIGTYHESVILQWMLAQGIEPPTWLANRATPDTEDE